MASHCGRSVDGVDNRAEVRDFLSTRHAKIAPERAGLPRYGQRRRVTGPRREEVAQLAGVSTDYYTRLEKGDLGRASDGVLEAVARALQLDDAERSHLLELARGPRRRAVGTSPRTVAAASVEPAGRARRVSTAPAFVSNGRMDLVTTNALARALYAQILTSRGDGLSNVRPL